MPSNPYDTRCWGAYRDVKLGMSVRAAAKKWEVSRTTVQRRIDGVLTRKETNKTLQALSPYLEGRLAHWAVGQARLGFAPSLAKFRQVANNLLSASGGTYKVGEVWHRSFLGRNPAVKTARSRSIAYSRVNGATVININLFFDRLDVPEVAVIPQERWYNSDEMGVGQGVGGDHWVICEVASRLALKKDIDKGEWITVFECISADGVVLPPLLILKGKEVQQQWFPQRNKGLWDDWRFKASPNGWTSNEIAMDWLQGVFIPHIRQRHGNRWVVMVLDGHESHTNDLFLSTCLMNKIWLVFYEPHCSHVVQALDVGIFGPLKKRLRHHLRDSPAVTLGIKPSKEEMMRALRLARLEILVPKLIKNAWATAGIFPRDRSRSLSSKYVMLESKGVARTGAEAPVADERPKTPDFSVFEPKLCFNTPSTGQDLLQSCRRFSVEVGTFNISAQRLVTRKTCKALDHQAEKIANLQLKVQYLETKVGKSVKTKRKKVKPPPGQRLVKMSGVRKVQKGLRSRKLYEDEASDCEVPTVLVGPDLDLPEDLTEPEDCITIENT